jgi:hypothetical protein
MQCRNCGAELNQNDKFCGNCGAPVPEQPVVNNQYQDPNQYQGPNPYQYQNPYPYPQYYQQQYTNPPKQLTPGKKAANIAIVVAMIAFIIVAYILIFYNVFTKYTSLYEDTFEDIIEGYEDSFDIDDDKDDDKAGLNQGYDDEEYEDYNYDEYADVTTPTAVRQYTGEYAYYTQDEWIAEVEGLIVNDTGDYLEQFLGTQFNLLLTRDHKSGMLIGGSKFYYINSDLKTVEFAPGTECAELCFEGGYMFYVLPTEGEGDDRRGDLYIFNTSTGISDMIASDIFLMSPVISPDGGTVAYTRVDGNKTYLCLSGLEKEEQKVLEGEFRACSVTNDGSFFYTDPKQDKLYRYKDGKSAELASLGEFTRYYLDRDMDEILITNGRETYYSDVSMDKASLVYDNGISTEITYALCQGYGQYSTRLMDVPTLKDVAFVAVDGGVFFVKEDGKGAIALDQKYTDIDNMKYDSATGDVLYSTKGVLYKANYKTGDNKAEVLYDKEYVETFFASYDLKDMWISTEDEKLYYFDGEKTELVEEDINFDYGADGDGVCWSADDGRLYYMLNDDLYSVYDSKASVTEVKDNVDYFGTSFGKPFFIAYDKTALYMYLNGDFYWVY